MIETLEKEKTESCCGLECSKCEFLRNKTCQGCKNICKPFWGESCPVKSCCENKNLKCCGECADFPCDLLKSFAYDENQGDNGLRIKNCEKWCQKAE